MPPEKNNDNEGDEITETSENDKNTLSTHPTDNEKDIEDSGSKRRRRGRRGGRRRRRRNVEDGQTDENQGAESQSADVKTSDKLGDISSETANKPNNNQNNTTTKAKPTRGQTRGATKTIIEKSALIIELSPTDTPISTNKVTNNEETARENKTQKKQTQSRKKHPASVKNVGANSLDNIENKTTVPDSSDLTVKKAVRTYKTKAKTKDKSTTNDQPIAEKKVADKKPARNPTKKATAKSASTKATKAVLKEKSPSRVAISSAPQDVVEIGSSEPKSPRQGWWSRS